MAREMVVVARCDLCGADATHLEVPVAVGTSTRRQWLDLCEGHYQELIQPLLDALAMARPYPKSAGADARNRQWKGRAIGPFKCQVPGCIGTPLKNRTTLQQHVRRLHELDFEEYVSLYGQPSVMSPDEDVAVEAKCPVSECGKVYSTALGNRWPHQALRNHLWGSHAIKMTPELTGTSPARARGGR